MSTGWSKRGDNRERGVFPEDVGGHELKLPVHEQTVVDTVPVQGLEVLFHGHPNGRIERPFSDDPQTEMDGEFQPIVPSCLESSVLVHVALN
eukprot:917170-Prorocentrum_lima.AAC.1